MSDTLDLARLDEAGFSKLYEERVRPCFETYEPQRLEAVEAFKRRLTWGLAISAVITVAIGLGTQDAGPASIIGVMGAIIAFAIAYAKINKVKRLVKIASCNAIAQSVGVTYTIDSFDPPAFARQKSLGLVPGFDRSHFEDLFQGAYQDASFDLCEAHLERRHTDSKGRTQWSTVFRGQLVRLAFPREFLGVTIVRRDAGLFNVFGGGRDLDRVRLEDPVFEKMFEVWGTDQVEARYLLHPAFMQRLVDLETTLRGKKLRCAFEKGDLLIAIEGGDLFEIGDMFKPLADPARARKIVDDIAGVMRVMDQVLTAQAKRGVPRSS